MTLFLKMYFTVYAIQHNKAYFVSLISNSGLFLSGYLFRTICFPSLFDTFARFAFLFPLLFCILNFTLNLNAADLALNFQEIRLHIRVKSKFHIWLKAF